MHNEKTDALSVTNVFCLAVSVIVTAVVDADEEDSSTLLSFEQFDVILSRYLALSRYFPGFQVPPTF